jgi:hypothetical protein
MSREVNCRNACLRSMLAVDQLLINPPALFGAHKKKEPEQVGLLCLVVSFVVVYSATAASTTSRFGTLISVIFTTVYF